MGRTWKILRWVVGVGVLLVFVVGGAAVFLVPVVQRTLKAQAERAQGTAVVIEAAAKGELIRTVSAPGQVRAKALANITSRVSAKIERIPFEEGAVVKEGDVLVELDSKELRASLAAAQARYAGEEASFKSAQANLAAEEARMMGTKAQAANAEAEWERQEALFKSGDVSQSSLDLAKVEMDRLKSGYDAAIAGLEAVRAGIEAAKAGMLSAQAEVERAQRNVDYATIVAPFDGVIVRKVANVGEVALGTVQNLGGTLLVLEDRSEIMVMARLAEMDAPRVAIGQKARAYINGYPDQTFDGTLRKVGLTTQKWTDQTTYFEAEIVLDTRGLPISSGTNANVDIEIETIRDVLLVPSQAVLDKRVDELPQKLRDSSPLVDREKVFARAVFVMKDGKAELTPVRTLAGSLTRTALAEGIQPGDTVIVGPYKVLQTLSDGARVRISGDDEKKKSGETVAEKEGGQSREARRENRRTAGRPG